MLFSKFRQFADSAFWDIFLGKKQQISKNCETIF